MHCLDLGVYQSICASCLLELAREGAWAGGSIDECFYSAHADYKAWCRGRRLPPCPRFEHRKICPHNDYPAFTQQTAKAAMTKHLVHWMYSVLRRPGISQGGHGALRFALFDSWVRFEDICTRNNRFVADADIPNLDTAVGDALLYQSVLHSEALESNELKWHILCKNHMSQHLATDFVRSTLVNPRRVTNYSDEDFVGKVKRIMSSCHGATAGKMGMYRYIILAGTRWWGRLAVLRGLH